MSDKQLRFGVNLIDKISMPAGDIADRLDKLISKLEGMDSKLEKVSNGGMESFITKLNSAWMVADRLTQPLINLLRGVYDVGEEFLTAGIKSARWKEDISASLTTVLGSSEKAGQAMKVMLGIAQKLPITTGEVFEYANSLLLAGYSTRQLPQLVTAISDIKKLLPDNAAAGYTFKSMLERAKTGGLTARDLLGMRELHIMPEFEKIMGKIAGRKGDTSKKDLQKILLSGQVSARDQYTALVEAVAMKEGGHLEAQSKAAMGTMSGILSNLWSRWTEVSMGFADTKGYKALKDVIAKISDLLDPASPGGIKIKASLDHLFGDTLESLVGGFTGPKGVDKITEVINGVSKAINLVSDAVQAAIGGFRAFFAELGKGLGVSSALFGPDGHLAPDSMAALSQTFKDLGKSIADLVVNLTKMMSSGLGAVLFKPKEEGSFLGDKDKNGKYTGQGGGFAEAIWGKNTAKAWAAGKVGDFSAGALRFAGNPLSPLVNAARDYGDQLYGNQQDATSLADATGLPKHAAGGHFDQPHIALVGDKPETMIPDGDMPGFLRRMGGGGQAGQPIQVSFNLHLEVHPGSSAQDVDNAIERGVHELRKEGPSIIIGAMQSIGLGFGGSGGTGP